MPELVAGGRPLLEVADVIRSHGKAFLQRYGSHLTPTQKKGLRDLGLCRTAALGGHSPRSRNAFFCVGVKWLPYLCKNALPWLLITSATSKSGRAPASGSGILHLRSLRRHRQKVRQPLHLTPAQVQIPRRRRQGVVSQKLLQRHHIDAGFEQMRRVAVP